MNNIFKTIWNKSTQSWVAVSELARGYVKSSSAKQINNVGKTKLSKFSLSFIALIIAISTSDEAFANYSVDGGVINLNGRQNIAIGKNARTGDDRKSTNQSVAIGSGNTSGDGAWAKGDQSIAIGGNTKAEGDSSIAIGGDDLRAASNNKTEYVDDNGIKKTASIETAYKSLTGNSLSPTKYQNTISKTLAIAVGVKTTASDLSLALGTFANASATNTVAIGSGATATLANSIAIGGGAKTDDDNPGTKQSNVSFGKTTFQWAGGENVLAGDIVSFGSKGYERQLKNIAPGAVSENSTDAVNGSQLYSITKELTLRSERKTYVHVNTGNASQAAGNATTNEGQVDEKGGATATGAATFGLNATASKENAIAIGTGATASHKNSIALGQGASTSDVHTDNLMLTFKNESYVDRTITLTNGKAKADTSSVSFGTAGKERQLHHVASGKITADSTDAINGSQLYHVATNLGFNVYENDAAKSRINNNSVVKFANGIYTTAVVTPENGNATVKFDVNVTTISDASTKTAQDYTVPKDSGLAKTAEVVNAINNSGFILKSSGLSNGHKITNGDSVIINKGNNIEISQNDSKITIALDSPTKSKIDSIGTGNVTIGDTNTVTGDKVKTAINEAINTVNLKFTGNKNTGTNSGKVVLETDTLAIKGEDNSPIETTSTSDNSTLTIKIKDRSIDSTHLKDNAVTEDKIADGSITFNKLGDDTKNTINTKEESVETSGKSKALGLTVSSNQIVGKGNQFVIDLDESILINKLSDGANISQPTNTPKLITDKILNTYLSTNPIRLDADDPQPSLDSNKISLGDTLSIKGKTGGLINTSVTGSSFVLDLNQDTKDKIAKIGSGMVADNDVGTVTGDAVYDAIAESSFVLNVNDEDEKIGEKIKKGSVLKIKHGKNISVERNKSTITIKTSDSPIFDSVAITNGPVLNATELNMNNKPITGVSSGLTKYVGSSKNSLVDLSNEATTPNSNVATVGDLRNMGWIVSSSKTTDNESVSYTDKIQNADEVAFEGTGLATVSGKTDTSTKKRTITVDVKLNAAQADGKTITIENGKIKAITGTLEEDPANKGKISSTSDPDSLVTAKDVVNAINKAGFLVKANSETNDQATTITSGGLLHLDTDSRPNLLITRNEGKFTFTLSKTPTFDSVAINNGPVLKNTGIDMKDKTISNLADGVQDNDAVNLKQLKETKTIAEYSRDKANVNEQHITKNTNNIQNINETLDAGMSLKTESDGGTANDDNQVNNKLKFRDTLTLKAGNNIDIKRNSTAFTIATSLTPTFTTVSITDGPELSSTGLNMNGKPITGLSNGLQSYTTGNNKDLVHLNPTVSDDTAATVGNLRKMGWVISSPNTTGAEETPYVAKVQNADEVEFVGKNLAKVSGKTENNKRIITVDMQLGTAQADNETIKIEDGVIKAVTTPIEEDPDNKGKVKSDTIKPNALATASNVADMINKAGFLVKANGEDNTKATKISSGDIVDLDASEDENLTISRKEGKFTFKVSKTPKFENISLQASGNAKPVKLTSNEEGNTLTLNGGSGTSEPVKLTNVADGDINEISKDAVTGKQLKSLVDTLGVETNGKTFTKPTFDAVKNKDGNSTALTTFKDAIQNVISAVNRGLIFGGDEGNPSIQYLGSKFDVKAATGNITYDGKTFVGKNLRTSYEKAQDGNGVLSIGLSDTPDFKKITLTDSNGNNVHPYLTLEKDGTENSGKISGLSERDATKNTDYGKNGNANRAATEGAVKEISERIKQSDNTSPFTYADEKGNPVVKANDGKFYPVGSINPDGSVKTGEGIKKIEPENVVVKVKDTTSMPITNVRSGLGLDGNSKDGLSDGTPSTPKTISVEKAQKIIAGDNLNGNGGLLTKTGVELNKVATIGDLQALAQAGLDFSGNKGDVIHRPLGRKLEILGKYNVQDLTGYSSENIATETKDNKLYIRFKDKPEFKGITVKDGDDKHQIELTPENGLAVKANKDDTTPVKITSSGIDAGDSKVTNLVDGNIAYNSKDAVTGNQLKNLADKLGVDTLNNSFVTPIFKEKIKDVNGTDANVTSPTTFKGAIDDVISALNRGIGFIGDIGNDTQYLGSKFAVKAAETTIDNKFVGKNLKTSYTKGSDGNGVLSIGLSGTPDFKKITLTDGDNNPEPYLTLEKDGAENAGKITGLTNRNPTNNADNYGKNGNEGRAATEGAVKELSDRVNQGDKNSPFVYEKADGTKITKATDGKFYPADKVNADGTKKDDAVEVPANEVVVKVNDQTPMPITNVRSGLGLDGKSDTDPTIGSQSEPKAISADKAITAIAGKDGKSGLLSKDGADLNKVSTIGDLQALAQAGLDFAGNKGTVIHRPLGTKLEILGNASIKDDELAKFSTDNIVTETKDDKLYIKFKDIPKLKGLELNSGNPNAKSITISPDDTGSKLTLSGGDNSDVQLDGLQKGQITDTSKNAVTGNQLKDLADKLGVDVNDEKTGFKMPEFTAIKGKDGKDAADTDKPQNLRDAVNKTIEAVNRGLTFTGDSGTDTQNLGSTFNVKSVDDGKELDVKGKKFVGKNITTKYEKDADGNGTLSIGISDKPDFEAVTLTKKGETTPFLTIGEDTENTDKPTTGKITGLTARDLSSNGYGVGDNVGRAATEGAVKDLYDKVKSNEGSSPFEYRDEAGNKLVKVGDKYYSEKDLAGKHIVDGKIFNDPVVKKDDKYYVAGPDGKPKLGTDGQPIMTEATTATIKDKAPATASNKQLTDISNVRSGLGLDGKSETNSVDGSPAEPKAISVEKAKEVIAGKDGKSGLLTTEGAPLNKVATIGDLQAVAKSGLTFKGNNPDAEVHRPLGTTLDIKGEATESTGTSGKNVYVHADSTNNSLTVKIKETPEFKGLELKDQNTNAIKFAPSEVEDKTDPNKKNAVLTLSSGTGPNNTVKLTGISDGDISPTSKDAVNGSQVFALSRGEVPKIEDKQITITQPDGSTTVIDAKNVIVDEKGNPLLKTYNVQGQGEHIENSVISAISNMNTEGIKFFHTNDGRNVTDRPQEQGLNEQDSSAGGVHSTAIGYRANAAGENGVAFGPDAVAGKILEEKEVTITERVNGKDVVTKRKVRVVEGVKNAIAIGAGARASNDNTISIGSGNQVNGKNSGAIGDPSYINADNAYAIGNNNKIEITSEKTFVLGNNVTVTTARSVFLGDAVGYVTADNKAGTTKGNAEYSEQKIGETTYKYAGGKANEVVGVVSVGNVKQDGTMETRRIQNVAPGLISDKSTDAINGSQLYAVMDSGWNLKAEEVDGTSGKVTKGKTDTTKVSIGKTVKVRAGNNVEIAHNKDESIDISTSMAPTFNSLNVNPGGTVNMGGNRVQNVGNAVEAGDAVNYGQFKAEVGKLDSRLQAGIAGAVASGTLVQAFNPNESLVAVGAGTYRGKSAVALGYSRVSDNGKIIIKVTGSTNTYGDVTGGASVGYKF